VPKGKKEGKKKGEELQQPVHKKKERPGFTKIGKKTTRREIEKGG